MSVINYLGVSHTDSISTLSRRRREKERSMLIITLHIYNTLIHHSDYSTYTLDITDLDIPDIGYNG